MNFAHPNRKTLITGKSGTGKTTLWIRQIEQSKARWVFVFDPERQFARKTRSKVATTIPALDYALATQRFIVFDSTAIFPGDRPQAFAFFCRWVLIQSRALHGVKVLAVDELQGVQSIGPYGIPKSFAEIGDEGRRQEIDLIMIGQRLNQINDSIRAQVNRLITFQHTDPNALKIMREMGVPVEQVATLPRFAYFDCDLDQGKFKRVNPTGAVCR
jgi:hypothetical protein